MAQAAEFIVDPQGTPTNMFEVEISPFILMFEYVFAIRLRTGTSAIKKMYVLLLRMTMSIAIVGLVVEFTRRYLQSYQTFNSGSWETLPYFILFFSQLFSIGIGFIVLVVKIRKVRHLLDGIDQTMSSITQNADHNQKTLRRAVRTFTLAPFPLIFFYIVTMILTRKLTQHAYKQTDMYFLPDNNTMVNIMFFATFSFFVLFQLQLIGFCCTIQIALSLIANNLLAKTPRVIIRNTEQLSDFTQRHSAFCRLVKLDNECFKELNFVWTVAEILIMITSCRAINIDHYDLTQPHYLVKLLLFSTYFFFRILVTANVNSKVKSSLEVISIIDQKNVCDMSPASTALAVKIQQYIHHIHITNPAITGWDIYVVNADVAIAAVTSIITYVLVLYSN